MRKIIFSAIACSFLFAIGCTHNDLVPLKGPDGQEWVAITCTHGAQNCWKAAGDFCPGGWVAADEVQSRTHGFLIFGHHDKDEMLVRCKAPNEAAQSPGSKITGKTTVTMPPSG